MNAPDVVVVGAGSAGCVVAARLSEDPSCEVLLLEAGAGVRPEAGPAALRGLNPFALQRPEHAGYRYDGILARRTTVAEPSPYLRGRGLGGSTLVNGHLAMRGEWTEEVDDPDEALDAFVALETDLDFGAAPYHGEQGPMPVSRVRRERWSPLSRAFGEAALALGHPWCPDLNAPRTTGASPYPSVLVADGRITAAAAYLDPARDRENLTVRSGVLVDRVLIEGGRAVGVRVIGPDGPEDLAAGEVVLAAGAVHSPAVLLRSGVGPAGRLRDLGVDAVADLPVGGNLQEHAAVWLGVASGASDPRPRVEPRFGEVCLRYSSGLAGTNDMFSSVINLGAAVPETGLAGMVNVCLYQVFSRGELVLQSPDPAVDPELDMRMVSDPRDVERLREGVRSLWELLARPELGAPRIVSPALGPVDALPATDTELDAWILRAASDAAHVTGTCRTGPPEDPRTVVDADGAVLGVDGLAVVDASVFAEIPRANTQLPTLMLAERWSRRRRSRSLRSPAAPAAAITR